MGDSHFQRAAPSPHFSATYRCFWVHLFLEVKEWISLVIPNPISPMVVAEFPKTFDRQCICRRIFVSLEKIFHFKYSQTIFHLVFTWNIYGKSVTRTVLGAHMVQMVRKYIWMQTAFIPEISRFEMILA